MDTQRTMRLSEWVSRWQWRMPDLVLHDPDGPRECLVRAGQLVAEPDTVQPVCQELRRWVDRIDPSGRIMLRDELRERSVEVAADVSSRWRVAPNHVHIAGPIMHGTPTWIGGPEIDVVPEPRPPTPETWDPPVTVAVLDTGLDPHPWFAGRSWFGEWGHQPEVLDHDVDGNHDWQGGHGTFVAGVLISKAPGVTIRHHRVLSSMGLTDDTTVAAALRAVRKKGHIDIILLTSGCYTADNQCPPILAYELAKFTDTVIVAAAGNGGSSRPFWPAAVDKVIAVAASDQNGTIAGFSNRGPWVNAIAPGVDITSSYVRLKTGTEGVAPGTEEREYGTAKWSGTSFAAPSIAADLAKLLHSGYSPADAVDRHSLGQPTL
ncbi:S8/S53 family peptidase [Kibdelosporangium philippinense]|uniref:S8/S53 family peptidase n=1 Tax=Kibdelosporangium philippinense TaxID=211113 RepID=A0ABS8ZE49_9PSEU|nr:S8/S53 family peptidase [Kibdelosporangium philippinense]MCE7005529.1 S8/S53 family peptidase [Kibdelosporangium philippinense]